MKKLLFAFLLGTTSFLLADGDFEGVIEAIDNEQKIIQVNGQKIKVLPNTKIEEDPCYLPWDISKRFSDLKVGDIVEMDVFPSNNILTASQIEIQCIKERAY